MKTVNYEALNYLIIFYVRFISPPLFLSIFPIISQHVSFLLTQRPRKSTSRCIITGHRYVTFKDVQMLPRRGACIQNCVCLVQLGILPIGFTLVLNSLIHICAYTKYRKATLKVNILLTTD
jgi:hypothetical protein